MSFLRSGKSIVGSLRESFTQGTALISGDFYCMDSIGFGQIKVILRVGIGWSTESSGDAQSMAMEIDKDFDNKVKIQENLSSGSQRKVQAAKKRQVEICSSR